MCLPSFTVLHVCFVRCHFDLLCTYCTDSRKEALARTISTSFDIEMGSIRWKGLVLLGKSKKSLIANNRGSRKLSSNSVVKITYKSEGFALYIFLIFLPHPN